MSGFSVFMNQDLTQADFDYLDQMKQNGYRGVFSSLHIPEDDINKYHERLIQLANATKERGLNLMVDISDDAIQKAGFSFDNLKALQEIGVTGLRMDDGITNKIIAKTSSVMMVGLNASTISNKDVEELRELGANFDHLEAWHNYYPRPETGLDQAIFKQKNDFLNNLGFKVVAFIPGDDQLRGPLFKGLPTLESHRNENLLVSELELYSLGVNDVYIGDPCLSEKSQKQHRSYYEAETIDLHAKSTKEWNADILDLVFGEHQQRLDAARDVIRSEYARENCNFDIEPQANLKRTVGSITLDNQEYGRYMGEVQVVKNELPQNPKVNVIAHVIDNDLSLLNWIKPGQKFRIIKID